MRISRVDARVDPSEAARGGHREKRARAGNANDLAAEEMSLGLDDRNLAPLGINHDEDRPLGARVDAVNKEVDRLLGRDRKVDHQRLAVGGHGAQRREVNVERLAASKEDLGVELAGERRHNGNRRLRQGNARKQA